MQKDKEEEEKIDPDVNEEKDIKIKLKERKWDDWKDQNPRGQGNLNGR